MNADETKEIEEKYVMNMLAVIAAEDGFDEMAHKKMDELLCSLLEELGYIQIVRIYNSTEKWYE